MTDNPMVFIETERLLIRPWKQEDLPILHSILGDESTMSWWPRPYTLEESDQWLQKSWRMYKDHRAGRWAVIDRATRSVIGDCGINWSEVDGEVRPDLGYIIRSDHWGNGYAIEAAKAYRDYFFDSLHQDRLWINMPTTHVRSEAVAVKLGFQKVGSFINTRNRNIEAWLYILEWKDWAQL